MATIAPLRRRGILPRRDVTLLHLPHEYASADLIPVPPPPSHLCTTSAHRCVSVTYTRNQTEAEPVLLVPSRADNGLQSIPFHLGRYTHLGTIPPRMNLKTAATYRAVRGRLATTEGEYLLADRPLQRSRYGRCTQKAMRKESAAATHRHTLSLAPNSITLLRAQRLSHQGVASQHEKPNEGAGFFSYPFILKDFSAPFPNPYPARADPSWHSKKHDRFPKDNRPV